MSKFTGDNSQKRSYPRINENDAVAFKFDEATIINDANNMSKLLNDSLQLIKNSPINDNDSNPISDENLFSQLDVP